MKLLYLLFGKHGLLPVVILNGYRVNPNSSFILLFLDLNQNFSNTDILQLVDSLEKEFSYYVLCDPRRP